MNTIPEPFIDWYELTITALSELWVGLIEFLPRLIGALIVFLIGWLIAAGIGKLIAEVLRKLRLNQAMEANSFKKALEKADLKIDFSGFIGVIFKWIIAIVFLAAAIDILGFPEFSQFLSDVVAYLPNVIVAAFIFIVAVIIADLLEKVIKASTEGIKAGYGNIIGMVAKWAIWIFAILAILSQLGVVPELIHTLFTGLVALLVIAGGLAFGLGGKEIATEIIQDIKSKLEQ